MATRHKMDRLGGSFAVRDLVEAFGAPCVMRAIEEMQVTFSWSVPL